MIAIEECEDLRLTTRRHGLLVFDVRQRPVANTLRWTEDLPRSGDSLFGYYDDNQIKLFESDSLLLLEWISSEKQCSEVSEVTKGFQFQVVKSGNTGNG